MKILAAAAIVLSASVLMVAGTLADNAFAGIAICILALVIGVIGFSDTCGHGKTAVIETTVPTAKPALRIREAMPNVLPLGQYGMQHAA